MPIVVHVVDRSSPAEAILEAGALAAAEYPLVCIGPPPQDALSAEPALKAVPLKVLPASRLASAGRPEWLPRAEGEGRSAVVCQCWSAGAARGIECALSDWDPPMVLRLAGPMNRQEQRHLLDLCDRRGRSEPPPPTLVYPTAWGADAARRAGLGVEIEVIPPPAAVPRASGRRRAAVRERLGIAPGEFLVAAPGTVHRGSGHRFAVWAAAVLVVGEFPVRLVVPHSGQPARDVLGFARQAGFGRCVVLTEAGVKDILTAADAAVFLGRDLPPLPVAMALAAGLPIIAADTPAAREWLTDGQNALLVAPESPRPAARALLKVIEDRGLSGRLAAPARALARTMFDPQTIRARWHDLYARLLTRAGREARSG